MKKILILLVFLTSCTYKYEVQVTYFNGEKESILITEGNEPYLHQGCLRDGGKSIRCGVRSFKMLSKEEE